MEHVSTLSPYLFTLAVDELTKGEQEAAPDLRGALPGILAPGGSFMGPQNP